MCEYVASFVNYSFTFNSFGFHLFLPEIFVLISDKGTSDNIIVGPFLMLPWLEDSSTIKILKLRVPFLRGVITSPIPYQLSHTPADNKFLCLACLCFNVYAYSFIS